MEDRVIKVYNLPKLNGGETLEVKSVMTFDLGVEFNLVRWMNFGEFNAIAACDFLSNIFVFKDGVHFKTYLNCHSKLITDMTWIFTFDYHNIL